MENEVFQLNIIWENELKNEEQFMTSS